jgi:hypothetical protein
MGGRCPWSVVQGQEPSSLGSGDRTAPGVRGPSCAANKPCVLRLLRSVGQQPVEDQVYGCW